VKRWLSAAACLIVALAASAFLWRSLPGDVRAVTGTGAHGDFLIEKKKCVKSCLWEGTFTPDDGGPAHKAELDGHPEGNAEPGDTVRAREGVRGVVYSQDAERFGGWWWEMWLGGILVDIVLLLVALGCFLEAFARLAGRRKPSSSAPRDRRAAAHHRKAARLRRRGARRRRLEKIRRLGF